MHAIGTLAAWLIATLIAYLLASVASTQIVLGGIEALGQPVPAGLGLRASVHDVLALWRYFLVLAIALGVGWFIGDLAIALLDWPRVLGSVLAGVLAVAATLFLMRAVYGVFPILGAQSPIGFVLQLAAGGIGGFAFALLRPRPR